jgi:hypothetical protein
MAGRLALEFLRSRQVHAFRVRSSGWSWLSRGLAVRPLWHQSRLCKIRIDPPEDQGLPAIMGQMEPLQWPQLSVRISHRGPRLRSCSGRSAYPPITVSIAAPVRISGLLSECNKVGHYEIIRSPHWGRVRPRGFSVLINYQLELGRLLDGEIGRLAPFKI